MSCKGHWLVKPIYYEHPVRGQFCLITRFGMVKSVHLRTDSEDICLTGQEMWFWYQGLRE